MPTFSADRATPFRAFPNVERWFTPEALLGVSLTTEFAASLSGYERDAVLVALSAKMRSIGNVDVDVVRAEYRKRPRENVDVRALVSRQLQKMARDVDASVATHAGLLGGPDSVSVIEASLLEARVEPGSVGHIITSPPYGVESLSYFRTHMLSFRSLEPFLDQDPYVVGEGVIGSEYLNHGTEETSFPRAERSAAYRRFFASIDLDQLGRNERRRAVMMMKFFDDMARVAQRFSEWLAPGGCIAFVIGNKRLGQHIIPTAEVVGELFEQQQLRSAASYDTSSRPTTATQSFPGRNASSTMSTCLFSAATDEMHWTEGMVHVATRAQLRADGWRLIAGQFPGGSDDELSPLNVVDPVVARDRSPDPRRHSLGKLVPDVVALKDLTLLIVEAKVGYSEADRLKLLDLLSTRRIDLYRALREFAGVRGFPELLNPERLTIVPALAFVRGTPPLESLTTLAVIRARSLTAADIVMPTSIGTNR